MRENFDKTKKRESKLKGEKMACFTAAIPEVIAVHIIKKVVEKKEAQNPCADSNKIAWSTKLSWLITMLWGGIFLLAIEHIWHGEIVPFPPFLTAMQSAEETQIMLNEILLIGGAMDIFIPAVWFVGCMLAERFRAKNVANLNLGA